MNRKTTYTYILSFILLIGAVVANRLAFFKMQQYGDLVDHTRVVINRFEQIANHFKSAQVYTPSFDSSAGSSFYKVNREEADQIGAEIQQLKKMTADNPAQQETVDSISVIINRQLPTLYQNQATTKMRGRRESRLCRCRFA